MSKTIQARRRIAAAIAAGCAGLALAGAAQAIDLRDWGRTFNTASERFVVLAQFKNEAVLDKETQLVWQRTPSGSKHYWMHSLHYCVMSLTGGRLGWRLPSISELTSLLGPDAKLPTGHPFQNVGAQDLYWSSTDQPSSSSPSNYAYTKGLLLSNLIAKNKSTDLNPFLCVRGVGSVDRS